MSTRKFPLSQQHDIEVTQLEPSKRLEDGSVSGRATLASSMGGIGKHDLAARFTPATLLAFQQTVGNRAIQRVVHTLVHDRAMTQLGVHVIQRNTGLAGLQIQKEFVDKFRNVDNLTALRNLVNETLKKIGVPAIKNLKIEQGLEGAAFQPSSWLITLDDQFIGSDAKITARDKVLLVELLYHEARHAEQAYRVAKRLASQSQDVSKLASALNIPKDIAEAAFEEAKSSENNDSESDDWKEDFTGKDLRKIELDLRYALHNFTQLSKAIIQGMNDLISNNDSTNKNDSPKILKDYGDFNDSPKILRDYGYFLVSIDSLSKEIKHYRDIPAEKDAWRVGRSAASFLGNNIVTSSRNDVIIAASNLPSPKSFKDFYNDTSNDKEREGRAKNIINKIEVFCKNFQSYARAIPYEEINVSGIIGSKYEAQAVPLELGKPQPASSESESLSEVHGRYDIEKGSGDDETKVVRLEPGKPQLASSEGMSGSKAEDLTGSSYANKPTTTISAPQPALSDIGSDSEVEDLTGSSYVNIPATNISAPPAPSYILETNYTGNVNTENKKNPNSSTSTEFEDITL